MLTIFSIPDAEKFLQLVARSRGPVWLHLADGVLCDLKQDHTAAQLLRQTRPGREGLRITLGDPRDTFRFLNYLMEVHA